MTRAVIEQLSGHMTVYVEATRGTAWSLFDAVVEYEGYRQPRNEQARACLSLSGDRAQTKERAFVALHDISRN